VPFFFRQKIQLWFHKFFSRKKPPRRQQEGGRQVERNVEEEGGKTPPSKHQDNASNPVELVVRQSEHVTSLNKEGGSWL